MIMRRYAIRFDIYRPDRELDVYRIVPVGAPSLAVERPTGKAQSWSTSRTTTLHTACTEGIHHNSIVPALPRSKLKYPRSLQCACPTDVQLRGLPKLFRKHRGQDATQDALPRQEAQRLRLLPRGPAAPHACTVGGNSSSSQPDSSTSVASRIVTRPPSNSPHSS